MIDLGVREELTSLRIGCSEVAERLVAVFPLKSGVFPTASLHKGLDAI